MNEKWLLDPPDRNGNIAVHAHGYRVASVHMRVDSLHGDHGERDKNAALIASAPDLLAALKAIVTMLKKRPQARR